MSKYDKPLPNAADGLKTVLTNPTAGEMVYGFLPGVRSLAAGEVMEFEGSLEHVLTQKLGPRGLRQGLRAINRGNLAVVRDRSPIVDDDGTAKEVGAASGALTVTAPAYA